MKKTWFTSRPARIAAAVIALLLLIRSCGGSGDAAAPDGVYAEVAQGAMKVTVRASGEVLSREANRIIPRIKRSVQVSFMVPEGSRVAKDDVMARFASEEIDQRLNEAEATLADRELQVVSARTDLEIQELDNANALKLAEQAVSDAQLELKKFTEGDEPKDVRAAELRIATSESERDRTIRKHAEAKDLLKEGFITEDQVEEERIAMETAAVEAETAQLELRILHEYDLPLRRNKALSNLEKARTELEKTSKKNEVQGQNKRQALDNAIRARDRAVLDLDALRKERVDFEVRAPIGGVVNYGDPNNQWRRGDIQVGMNLNPGEVLFTLPDMSAMMANVNVPEADVDKVKAGQPASVYIEAMGRRSFTGEVVRVAEVANPSGWMSADVKEFKVEISLPGGEGLRPGFSCEAEIVVDVVPETLLLPIQAVFRDGDGWVVYKGAPATAEKKPVGIGRISVTHIEVLDGLKKGERVLLNPVLE
ncbi:MAG TPA: efflux RND transporter periplasmic adaptor subunit [Kiritimatiellia bacterium]|nr:efflux RND transporter periplasmic adaptor subunit [Kiritimatiellia bacterium]HMP32716.1 efflux RND transporter periplasmic adaptor subunit [Kiritimatiellia bacterium]